MGSTLVVIKGLTRSGQLFRPSDWAVRLALTASAGSCPAARPLCFHPLVRIGTVANIPAVLVDSALEKQDPELFYFLMDFAERHDLQYAHEPVAHAAPAKRTVEETSSKREALDETVAG